MKSRYPVFGLLIFIITGCGGINYSEQPGEIVELSQYRQGISSTRVLAKAEEWRNSGIKVMKGSSYRITAKGKWKGGAACNWTGPDGVGAHTLICPKSFPVVEGWTMSTLIAKVGEDGAPFAIGDEYILEPKKDGALLFRINELSRFCYDNEGYMTATTSMIEYSDLPLQKQNQNLSSNAANNWAVIIGISKYEHSGDNGLTDLIFADDDAKAFAGSLRNLGWNESHIKLLTNKEATQRNIMIALESWLSKAGPDDQIVLFWAGHGFPDPEDPEKVYFACYDTDMKIPATGYRMDQVRRALEERKSKNVVLLADTCHAGKLITRGDQSRGISIVPNINKMAREQKIPKGWVFMVGADTDRQSIEHSSWANGAFTHSLIKGLNGEADGYQSMGPKDSVVTMGELRAYMNTAMPDETQKVLGVAKRPVITTSTGDPDIWNLTLQVAQ